jgi:radical SAM superfamily enzyme YgiQ (UPF0313 family)
MRIFLVGITGSSSDLQLSVFALKAALLAHTDAVVEVGHYNRIPPDEFGDMCVSIARDVVRFNPDMVGFSVYTWNTAACQKIAKIVKWLRPNVVTVFGGPEISDIEYEAVDYVVTGEGELPFIELVKTGKLIKRTMDSLDDVPSPYLSGYIPDELLKQRGMKAVIETQRGCNFRCAYCRYHSNFPTIRYKNVGTVIAEAKYAQAHGATSLRFADGNFLSDKERATNILYRLVQAGVTLPLFFEVIPSFVYPDFVDAIRAYQGQVTVGIGLQTLNEASLKVIRRHQSIDIIKRAYKLLERAGATIITDVILGLPLETKDTFTEVIGFMAEVMQHPGHVLAVSNLLILPDTDMEQIAEEYGLTVGDDHFVYDTPTMPRADFIDCAHLVAAAYLTLNKSIVVTLEQLQAMAGKMTVTDNLEHYWLFDVFEELEKLNVR